MNRIENLSDQLGAYAQEVARAVIDIRDNYGFTTKESLQIINIAIKDMEVDILHHIEENF